MIYPKEEYGSAYEIPFEEYYNKGYRAVIFDIDNTLVPHGAPADERSEKLCQRLRGIGFQICFLSNNNTRRVAPFAEALGAKYVSNGGKPMKKGFRQAAALLQVDSGRILFVGDQLLTDIVGANRMKIYSILVGPVDRKEGFGIILKRWMEKISLFFYRKSRKYKGNRPDRKGYEHNIPDNYR